MKPCSEDDIGFSRTILATILFGAAGMASLMASSAAPQASMDPAREGAQEASPRGCGCVGAFTCVEGLDEATELSQKWLYMTPGIEASGESCTLMSRDEARAACERTCPGTCGDSMPSCAEE